MAKILRVLRELEHIVFRALTLVLITITAIELIWRALRELLK